MGDPFPEVSGRGVEQLRGAGIAVEVGLLEEEARIQNAPYLKLIERGRPYVIGKWAMTLDGKIATHAGDSHWITGEAAQARVHQLRGRMDAIIVGVGTVLADDPMLTARPAGPRKATRIVLDSRLRTPVTSRLVQTVGDAPVLFVHLPDVSMKRRRQLEAAGCECLAVEAADGRPDAGKLLDDLGRRRFTNILVEGGAGALGSFFDAGEIDEIWAFMAPRLIGGDEAISPIGGRGVAEARRCATVGGWSLELVGEDVLIRGRVMRR